MDGFLSRAPGVWSCQVDDECLGWCDHHPGTLCRPSDTLCALEFCREISGLQRSCEAWRYDNQLNCPGQADAALLVLRVSASTVAAILVIWYAVVVRSQRAACREFREMHNKVESGEVIKVDHKKNSYYDKRDDDVDVLGHVTLSGYIGVSRNFARGIEGGRADFREANGIVYLRQVINCLLALRLAVELIAPWLALCFLLHADYRPPDRRWLAVCGIVAVGVGALYAPVHLWVLYRYWAYGDLQWYILEFREAGYGAGWRLLLRATCNAALMIVLYFGSEGMREPFSLTMLTTESLSAIETLRLWFSFMLMTNVGDDEAAVTFKGDDAWHSMVSKKQMMKRQSRHYRAPRFKHSERVVPSAVESSTFEAAVHNGDMVAIRASHGRRVEFDLGMGSDDDSDQGHRRAARAARRKEDEEDGKGIELTSWNAEGNTEGVSAREFVRHELPDEDEVWLESRPCARCCLRVCPACCSTARQKSWRNCVAHGYCCAPFRAVLQCMRTTAACCRFTRLVCGRIAQKIWWMKWLRRKRRRLRRRCLRFWGLRFICTWRRHLAFWTGGAIPGVAIAYAVLVALRWYEVENGLAM